MLKIIDKHPFISGFVVGFIGVGMVGKNLRKFIKGKITIIQIDIPSNQTFSEEPSGEENPKVTEEN